jgi:hypothetical protein
MPYNFEIPITYKGKEHSFRLSLITAGYTYKVKVDVFGKIISYEPDEERNFRAVISQGDLDGQDKIDKGF